MRGAHIRNQLSRCLIHVRKKKRTPLLHFAQIFFILNRFPFHYFTPLTFPASDSTSATFLSTFIFVVTFKGDVFRFRIVPSWGCLLTILFSPFLLASCHLLTTKDEPVTSVVQHAYILTSITSTLKKKSAFSFETLAKQPTSTHHCN